MNFLPGARLLALTRYDTDTMVVNPSAEPARPFLAHLERGREQSLRSHLLGVSGAARKHAEKIGIGPAGAAIGLLHDLGKYSRAFQEYLARITASEDTEQRDPERGKIDHSTAGAQTIWRELKSQGIQQGIVGEMLAICVASHHSGLIDCIAPDGTDKLSRRINKADPQSHHDEAWANAESEIAERNRENLHDAALVSGFRDIITRICRIDSNRTIQRFNVGLLVRFLFSCLIDGDRTDTVDFSNPAAARCRTTKRNIFTNGSHRRRQDPRKPTVRPESRR